MVDLRAYLLQHWFLVLYGAKGRSFRRGRRLARKRFSPDNQGSPGVTISKLESWLYHCQSLSWFLTFLFLAACVFDGVLMGEGAILERNLLGSLCCAGKLLFELIVGPLLGLFFEDILWLHHHSSIYKKKYLLKYKLI